MTTAFSNRGLQSYIPCIGDIRYKHFPAYQTTRIAAKLVNAAQLSLGEAYIRGLNVSDSTLRHIFKTVMPPLLKHFPALLVPYEWVLEEAQLVAEGSDDLMAVQYDRPPELFSHMLGDGELIYPKYSMALWEKGAADLEQAQIHMMDDMIEKLGIEDGDRILDIGCGWGCIANYILSKFPNATITGLNLSHEQCDFIRNRMTDSKSYLKPNRFTLIEENLNTVTFDQKFNKVLSVGLFEHIGNLAHAFRKVASFLDLNGRFFLHIITVRTPNNISSSYTHKYIFPYGRYWSFDSIPKCNQNLRSVKSWYMNGSNYHKTFRQWLDNFDASIDEIKDLNYGIDFAKFRRIWRFYLIFLGTNFACCDGEINGNGQYLLIHR